MRKRVIGVVGDTIEQAEEVAKQLGGRKMRMADFSHSRTVYDSGTYVFECREYEGKSENTMAWDGVIFVCEKAREDSKTANWLKSLR